MAADRIITLNKSKLNSLILLHGLFANSGFWMNHLNLFKNFKLILIDINYQKLFNREIQLESLNDQITSILIDNNDTVGVISHSYGTILSQNLKCLNNYFLYQICPINNVISKNHINFNNYVRKHTKFTEEEIITTRMMANRFIETKNVRDFSLYNYIPIYDQYFQYPTLEKSSFFRGDHFKIEQALKLIVNSIIKCN